MFTLIKKDKVVSQKEYIPAYWYVLSNHYRYRIEIIRQEVNND